MLPKSSPFQYLRNLTLELDAPARASLKWDIARGIAKGVIASPVIFVLGLLIAHSVFEASPIQRACIVIGPYVGMLIAIHYERLARQVFASRNTQAAAPVLLYLVGVYLAVMARSAWPFVLGCMLMSCAEALRISALTSIWRSAYPKDTRGQLVSVAIWSTAVSAIASSALGGYVLDTDVNWYPMLFGFFALASIASSIFIMRMRRVPMPEIEAHVLKARSLVTLKENPVFARILFAWFLVGFGMHLVVAQKVEYLIDPRIGFSLTNLEIVLIASALSEVVRVVFMPFFATLFDRVNFISLRISFNVIFLGFFLLYFNTQSIPLIILGSFLHGLGIAGAMIAWNLWVTKYAQAEHTGIFMAIHTFLTGVRGVLAPICAYALVDTWSISSISWLAFALCAASTLVLLQTKRRYPGEKFK
jgi:predicted MFS family arabinose efflux permease